MFQFPNKMKKVFKEEDVQNLFEKQGYVILDFYTPEEVQYLLSLYKELHPEDEKGFIPPLFLRIRTIESRPMKKLEELGQEASISIWKM